MRIVPALLPLRLIGQVEQQMVVPRVLHFDDQWSLGRIAVFLRNGHAAKDNASDFVVAGHHSLAVRVGLERERAIFSGLAGGLLSVAIPFGYVRDEADRGAAQRSLF